MEITRIGKIVKQPREVLFWNEDGMITCSAHTPPVGGEKWVAEHWMPMPEEFTACDVNSVCEVCIEFDSIDNASGVAEPQAIPL